MSAVEKQEIDLITFEVLRNAFVAAAYEASTTIERIAYHPVIGLGRDRSNALLTASGELVAHGHTDAGAHYGSFEASVIELLKDFPAETMKPKQSYLFSDPYRTGSHVNDTRMIRPIFYKDKLVAFACTVIHWPDMGGPNPGTFNPKADSCYAEGIRIPPTLIYDNDELLEPIWNLLAINIRGSIERRGDITGQFEAGRLIERRVIELCEKYGPETVIAAMYEQFDYTESLMLQDMADIPDGSWYMEDFGDRDCLAEGETPIKVACRLTVKGTKITFDWSESGPQPIASWGGARATLIAGTYLGFMICFPHLFPLNNGVTRNIEIISKPSTSVHVVFPGGTTGYCSGAFDKIEAVSVGLLGMALASTKPWRVFAAGVSLTNLCLGGTNPRNGHSFVQYTYPVGGEGARSFKDGKSLIFMRFANAMSVPQELEERWFPMIYDQYEARVDSCGHGKYRGGFALGRRLTVTSPQVFTIHGDREVFTPWGMAGGLNGGGSMLWLNEGSPNERNVGMYATGVHVQEGDRLYHSAAGGGGFGDPLERDPELILNDVADEWLSIEAAKKYYGVIVKCVDEDAALYEIDEEASAKLKAEMAVNREKYFPHGFGEGEINKWTEDVKIGWEPSPEEVQAHITISRPPGW